MIRRTGHADLPLHTGLVPKWLADRMMLLGTRIVESIVLNHGKQEVLTRLSDPLWFQSFGAALGMDWHSSGITTSVMYALKRGLNPRAHELGLFVAGGRGKYSRNTPDELLRLSDSSGLDGNKLVLASKLCAKVDGAAVQDGFQLYMHHFVLSSEGDWAVVQQGMNTAARTARRYHWSSENVRSFVDAPHTAVTGENQGKILNLTDSAAEKTRGTILSLSHENPDAMMREIAKISGRDYARQLEFDFSGGAGETTPEKALPAVAVEIRSDRNIALPARHDVRAEDIDLKRLGAVLAAAHEAENRDFESLLLTPGLGPRTLQSLALVSELVYGTPSRFSDPARFSFAHGGKDGHPFPVPCRIYDESIRILGDAIEKSNLGYDDKSGCLKRLFKAQLEIEERCDPRADFDAAIAREKAHSAEWGGRTCMD